MKRPTFPSVNIGNPVERSGFAVFPIFVAQLNLFDIHDPKPPYAVADSKQRRKVLACNRKLDGLTLPSLTNSKDIPLLILRAMKSRTRVISLVRSWCQGIARFESRPFAMGQPEHMRPGVAPFSHHVQQSVG